MKPVTTVEDEPAEAQSEEEQKQVLVKRGYKRNTGADDRHSDRQAASNETHEQPKGDGDEHEDPANLYEVGSAGA